ncbi:MAG: hypothetical protein KAS32_24610 [Candidatus Peribacteraceae bacterium]|nr:hypothetical protein [Candidatus Peribacteraceae bacterium]
MDIEIDIAVITSKIISMEQRLEAIESKLAELVDLLSCDDCDCEDDSESPKAS